MTKRNNPHSPAIPIDALRAFVAVVERGGFTRAAEALGRTQPTVSLQVKRLEDLMDAPLFERGARLELTPMGAICLEYGREILDRHDEMLEMGARQRAAPDAIRLGLPSEFAALLAADFVDLARREGGAIPFEFTCDASEALLERFRARQLDMAVAVTEEDAAKDALARWSLPMSWIVAPHYRQAPDAPVRLITTPDGSIYHRVATGCLHRAARSFEIVCRSDNIDVLRGAIDRGLGVGALPRRLAREGARHLPSSQIGALPNVSLALFSRANAAREADALIARVIERLGRSSARGAG